jgi:hypothetical protein
MATILNASIDLTKIPKDAIYVGKKGKYANISITINDELDQFGNQGDSKAPKTYLGNVNVVWTNGNNVEPAPKDNAQPGGFQQAPPAKAVADDLPF